MTQKEFESEKRRETSSDEDSIDCCIMTRAAIVEKF